MKITCHGHWATHCILEALIEYLVRFFVLVGLFSSVFTLVIFCSYFNYLFA